MIRLVVPTIENKQEALMFRQAFFNHGENTIDGSGLLDRIESYEEWFSLITDNSHIETLRENSVLTDTYFALDQNNHIVGIIDLRHELNDFLKDFGHIGYSVLPSKRRQGYASEMLRLILDRAKSCGLSKVQLSTLRSNVASVKTIQKNGGYFVRSFDFVGEIADVYYIDL